MKETWLIISWTNKQNDMGKGFLLATVDGTEEEATVAARDFVPQYSPIGIVREIKIKQPGGE